MDLRHGLVHLRARGSQDRLVVVGRALRSVDNANGNHQRNPVPVIFRHGLKHSDTVKLPRHCPCISRQANSVSHVQVWRITPAPETR
jgi:hypothetical protein